VSIESTVSCVENWQGVRLQDCDDDFEFSRTKACRLWLRHFVSFAIQKVGLAPKIRLNAYIHGGYTVLIMDLFSNLPSCSKNDIAMSICLLNDRIYLPLPVGTQFDIELPGIVDAFKLMGTVVAKTQGVVEFNSLKVMQLEK
jgi:hypothetical protein